MSFLQRRKTKIFLSSILTVYLLSTFADNVFAQNEPNIHIGALELHPFASVKQTYDTNIYLEPEGEENDDFISDVALGMGAEMPLIPEREKDFMIKASYQADIIMFWDQDQRNRVDHTVRALLDCAFANDFRLRVKEHFKKTADPPNSERTSLDKRYRNTLDSALAYTREKITLEAGYMMTRDGYNDLTNLNKTDDMLTTTCFYQIFPKTSILAEYNFGVIAYDNNETNSDSKYHQGRLGLVGDLWPKITGTLKTGYRYVTYDESDKDDFSGFTVFANIKYDLTQRTEMNLYAQRTSRESSYSTNSYFESNKIGAKLNHQLLERLWFNAGGFFQHNRYPTETTENSVTAKRKDALWGLNAGLKYEIKEWLFINTDYEFKQRDSKFDTFDYNDHKILAEVSIRY